MVYWGRLQCCKIPLGAFWWQPEANCSNEKIFRENRQASTERSSLDRGSFYMEEGFE